MSPLKFAKPSVPQSIVRHERKLARQAHERREKQATKARDWHKCRWPRCEYSAVGQPLEAAHVEDAGMGGSDERMRRDNLVTLCRLHHRTAPQSIHSGDLKIEALTGLGTDGPLSFWQRDEEGRWYLVTEETAIGIFRKD